MSTERPNRAREQYKFQRVREQIRRAVESGELTGKLPGERALSEKFGVNAKTLGKALTDLCLEGLLVRRVGRGTFVSSPTDAGSSPGRSRRFGWLVRGDLAGEPYGVLFEPARARVERNGHTLALYAVAPDEDGRLASDWLKPRQLREIDGVIVAGTDPSQELLVDLHRRRIPVVAADAWTGSIRTDAVHSDFARGAFELTEQFAWCGHRRIALVLPLGCPLVGREAERGYQTAMSRNGLSPMVTISYVPGSGAIPLSSVVRPSAVIGYPSAACDRFLAMVGGSSGSSANASSAGPSVGLLCSPGERPPSGNTESVQNYQVSGEDFVEWAVRLLLEAEPGHPPRQAIVPGRLMGITNPRPDAAGPFTSPGPAHV